MKFLKIILTITFLCNSLQLISQNKTTVNKHKSQELSLNKRLNINPFYKSSSIMLISFNLKFDGELKVEKITDSLNKNVKEELKIDDFSEFLHKDISTVLRKTNQKKLLNVKEIIDLTDVLFNTCYRHKTNQFNEIGCYFPRNAILFLDDNNVVMDYIEICFECRKIKTSITNLKRENICPYLMSDLEFFFNKLGVKTKEEK